MKYLTNIEQNIKYLNGFLKKNFDKQKQNYVEEKTGHGALAMVGYEAKEFTSSEVCEYFIHTGKLKEYYSRHQQIELLKHLDNFLLSLKDLVDSELKDYSFALYIDIDYQELGLPGIHYNIKKITPKNIKIDKISAMGGLHLSVADNLKWLFETIKKESIQGGITISFNPDDFFQSEKRLIRQLN